MPITVETLALPDVKIIRPVRHGDDRGYFCETYSERDFFAAGIECRFVQDNHAKSAEVGTVRGLHFQSPPFAQDKLVRVVKGAIIDVAVDVRHGSPTFGQHVMAKISAEEGNQIFVPVGFAHGMVTLEPDTEVIYKVSDFYSADHDKGLLWNDPALAIDWPVKSDDAILSAKDKTQPLLKDLPDYFSFAGAPA